MSFVNYLNCKMHQSIQINKHYNNKNMEETYMIGIAHQRE